MSDEIEKPGEKRKVVIRPKFVMMVALYLVYVIIVSVAIMFTLVTFNLAM